ncbi:DNA repair protein RAD51 homolog 4-like [Anopheles bellator]|uniref:DNA repair protein RAD51 homolog 4-like n=1 Tax=Anopheles bellator TaxID=139047 RepID=UPI002648661E|nr:DNA repair protein RAD51 homolog 4-like [Anopheles bellator]
MAASLLKEGLHPTLTEYVIKLLQKNYITTVFSFVNIDTYRLSKITNMTMLGIGIIKRSLLKRFAGFLISKAVLIARRQPSFTTTGTSDVDKLLQGGLLRGHIYELCGESLTGKTQFCLSIAAHVAYEYRQLVYYIDTKCDFSANRIQQLLERHYSGAPVRTIVYAMNRIKVERVFSPELLVQVVQDLASTDISEVTATPKLLIIDSLPALWFLLHNSKSSSKRLGLLTKLVCALRRFAARHLVSVVLVNLAVPAYGKQRRRRIASTGVHPALGRFWESAPGTRLLMQKKGEKVLIRVWKSSYLRSKAHKEVRITNTGFLSNPTKKN